MRIWGMRAAILLLLLGSGFGVGAAEVEGKDVAKLKLDADEGLIALVVDDGVGMVALRLDGIGHGRDMVITHLSRGRNLRVLKVPVGTYRWSNADLATWAGRSYLNFPQAPRFQFEVKPGVINYPGDISLARASGERIRNERVNRTSLAMVSMDRLLPGLRQRFDWRTEGDAADDYPNFLKRQTGNVSLTPLVDAADAELKKTLQHEIPAEMSKMALELISAPPNELVRLSPDGTRLAYVTAKGQEVRVVVSDLASKLTFLAYRGPNPIRQLVWGGKFTLYIGLAAATITNDSSVEFLATRRDPGLFQLSIPPDAKSSEDMLSEWIGSNAWLVDGLPANEKAALITYDDDKQTPHVYRINEGNQGKGLHRFDVTQMQSQHRLDKGLSRFGAILADADGQLRVALSYLGTDSVLPTLMVRTEGTSHWEAVHSFTADDDIELVALDRDGSHVIALSNVNRAQVELVRFDPRHPEQAETLLGVPGVDLRDALVRPKDQAVLGATLIDGGVPQVRFIDQADDARLQDLRALLPGKNVVPLDESLDGGRILVLAYAEDDPGSFYVFDAAAKKLEKQFDNHVEFKLAKPVRSERFTTRRDGVDVVALLSMPPGEGKRWPLVVMPHGGPFGAADSQTFSPRVQFLVNRGYAVLRVNYRGSGGSGRNFQAMGYMNWGRQIEDDIEAAVSEALKKYPLDAQRVALVGASYGGYSTLMGLIRSPERYRCGVAISAVSDLPLMFSSSDWSEDKALNSKMRAIVGDPEKARTELEQYSPVYQYEKLDRPLLLIHGGADRRVPIEHAMRLLLLLSQAKRPPQWLPIWGSAHDLSLPRERLAVYATTDVFLGQCLAAPAQSGAAP
jgi:dipeptidyl aminopeptidase/acylaminoacyl peptidase